MKIIPLFLFHVLLFSNVFAQDQSSLQVLGRTFANNCSYYSNRAVDLEVHYKNSELVWGSKVELEYGWTGFQYVYGAGGNKKQELVWQEKQTIEMTASDAFVWSLAISDKVLHLRGTSLFYDQFDFVIKVTHPDGSVTYDRGSDAALGHYRISLGLTADCIYSVADKKPMEAFEPIIIQK